MCVSTTSIMTRTMENKTMKYYYLDENRKPVGPFSEEEFDNLHLAKGTMIWHTGLKEWVKYTPKEPKKKIKLNKKWLIIAGGVLLLIAATIFVIIINDTKSKIRENAYDSAEFQMYLDKYYRDLDCFGISYRKPRTVIIKKAPMQYFDDTKDYHGVSYGYDDDDIIEIYINEDSWKKLSRPQKYLLMYHELSHDILNLDDLSDDTDNYGKLMCPFIITMDKISMDEFIEMSHALFEEMQ